MIPRLSGLPARGPGWGGSVPTTPGVVVTRSADFLLQHLS